MYLERPQWKTEETQRQTVNEWIEEKAARGAQLLQSDALAVSPHSVETADAWGALAGHARHWAKTKGRHHVHVEVRHSETRKALYGPLKVYAHDLGEYIFTMDTVWAFLGQHRADCEARAQRMFEEENARYVETLDSLYERGAKQVFDPLYGECAVFPDGTAEFFIASDELTDAHDEADNFVVVFSVEPLNETKTKTRRSTEDDSPLPLDRPEDEAERQAFIARQMAKGRKITNVK